MPLNFGFRCTFLGMLEVPAFEHIHTFWSTLGTGLLAILVALILFFLWILLILDIHKFKLV